MKDTVRNVSLVAVLLIVTFMTGIGLYATAKTILNPPIGVSLQTETVPAPLAKVVPEAPQSPSAAWSLKEPSQAAEFISGPVAASVGELCVFRLNDSKTYADWHIVPEATCYVDSSGSSLAFASNNRAEYTILAAIVEDGVPKILTHICEYGIQPRPEPEPSPNPDPTPTPIVTLKDWVSQNVPESGKKQAAALASCYESTAIAIEKGSIRTQAAAFSTIRTASQTKIDVETWSVFLEELSIMIAEKLSGNTDAKVLGTIFTEIADGLRERLQDTEAQIGEPNTLPMKPEARCLEPQCQQPMIQYRRAR